MRQVLAYFYTENEAEDVRLKLELYKHEQLEIGALPEALDRGTPLLLPFAFAAGSSSGPVGGGYAVGSGSSETASAGAFFGLTSLDAEEHDRNRDGIDDRALLYSLSVRVREEDYLEVVDKIRRSGGHVAHIS
ncbi:hypothetical protein [Paenibacillus rigui]|uniref:Uncharacterized protein n=1 Tax=Paenibacillus rigui TaxID=554312 RepID=A0A229UHJ2_9BACL|nr:hypothetical protein [Paenibacillus rigui]OXM82830.1 hypothetical protein CF651_28745 [Paenibacillus rigui]